jgi:hypothetical protein
LAGDVAGAVRDFSNRSGFDPRSAGRTWKGSCRTPEPA